VKKKLKLKILLIFLFFNLLIIDWNFDLEADNIENKYYLDFHSFKHPRNEDFDLGGIEVISEPIYGQNNNIDFSTGVRIAVENDKIYIVWHDKSNISNNGIDWDIFYRHFDGSNWSEIQVISEPEVGKDKSRNESSNPDIAVFNSKIFVVWHDYNNMINAGGDSDIFYRCNLSGNNWEDIQVISEPVYSQNINIGDSSHPKIEINNNKIYVVWQDNNNTEGAGMDLDVFYKCNLTGSEWEDTQVISEPIFGTNKNIGDSRAPDIKVNNNKVYLVWDDNNNTENAGIDRDIFFRCNLNGLNWENIQVISEPILNNNFNIGFSTRGNIIVENGNIYVVWQDDNNTNGAGTDFDIFYRSNLTGITWENVQVLSESDKGKDNNIADSGDPKIDVENGNLYVVWHDSNKTKGSGEDYDIFFICNLSGLNWENVEIISEYVLGNNTNTYDSLAPDIAVNSGKSHIVWNDENNTKGSGLDFDIFYRWIKDPLPMYLSYPSITPQMGNTSTYYNFTVTYFHLDNIPPQKIIVNLSDVEYLMLEIDPFDNNYIDGKNYYFTIKNLNIGIHTLRFIAYDGKYTFHSPIINKPIVENFPPNIITKNNIIAFEDQFYEVKYEFDDIDIKTVGQLSNYWNFSTNSTWLDFNFSDSILSGTPRNNDIGNYWVNITINDSIDSDFTNFTLTVINVNDAPIIITKNITIINEDEYYEVTYEAIDIDNPQSILKWFLNSNASWLHFDSRTGILNGTPDNGNVGTYWVNISVNDNEYTDWSNFTLTVVNINDPPDIITEDNKIAIEDEYYKVVYNVKDVDNTLTELKWFIDTNANWLGFNASNFTIFGIPRNNDVGEYWVNVSVYDNEYPDFRNFTLTVFNTNDPPEIITEDITNATIGELYFVNYEVMDIDPDPTIFKWFVQTNNTHKWLTIDSNTGWLGGIPKDNDFGIFWVNVSVSDNNDGWAYHNFTINISKVKVIENNAPQLFNASLIPIEGSTNTVYTFSILYFDIDGDIPESIQVVIDNALFNMKLRADENASNGIYEYFTLLSEGKHTYYFIGSDGFELIKTNNLTTPEIEETDKISKKGNIWNWVIPLLIVIVIILLFISFIIIQKRKGIPLIKAELLHKPPEHITQLGVSPTIREIKSLPIQPSFAEKLTAPEGKAQPEIKLAERGVSSPVPTLAPSPIQSQYQLPRTTLSKEQRLGLLKERLLRGEITEDTYKDLKTEIEGGVDIGITKEKLKTKEKSSPPSSINDSIIKPPGQLPEKSSLNVTDKN
jgi:hypothetical protein